MRSTQVSSEKVRDDEMGSLCTRPVSISAWLSCRSQDMPESGAAGVSSPCKKHVYVLGDIGNNPRFGNHLPCASISHMLGTLHKNTINDNNAPNGCGMYVKSDGFLDICLALPPPRKRTSDTNTAFCSQLAYSVLSHLRRCSGNQQHRMITRYFANGNNTQY